jgi:hypothetical protein
MLSKLRFALAGIGVALFASAGAQAATFDAGGGNPAVTTIENLSLGGGTDTIHPHLVGDAANISGTTTTLTGGLTTDVVNYYWGLTIVTPPGYQTITFIINGLNVDPTNWDAHPFMSIMDTNPADPAGAGPLNSMIPATTADNPYGNDLVYDADPGPGVTLVNNDTELKDYNPTLSGASEVPYNTSGDYLMSGGSIYTFTLTAGEYLLHGFFDINAAGVGIAPDITLTAVPVPPAMLLFASGLVGLAAAGRKRWKKTRAAA